MAEIILKNVCKNYGAHTNTIQNVNLQIGSREFCVFVGPSGCGKSTLLRMIAGLEDISSGELLIDGVRMNEKAPSERGVSMVFQSYALYPHMTVRQNMAFGLKIAKTARDTIDSKVQEAAEILQLGHLLDRLPKELSGGQRQRVAIGRAIVRHPKVFLFDEPLSNLDAALRVQTRIEIARLHQKMNHASMVYVTHDQVEAMTLADKIVLLNSGEAVLREGSVAQCGAPLTLYHFPVNKFVAGFIGSPKMNFISGKLLEAHAQSAQIMVGEVSFEVRVDARALARDAVLEIGVRPEHIVVDVGRGPNSIHGTVEYIEELGDSTFVYVRIAQQNALITARQSGDCRYQMGDQVYLHMPAECIHAFDAQGVSCTRTVDLTQLQFLRSA